MSEVSIPTKDLRISKSRNDTLKLIAMITMFIDHFGLLFMQGHEFYSLFRTIGRIAFPIFAYQVALGYSRTSNLKKYIERLALFALISQIPYMWLNATMKFNPLHFNVIFMLLFGIISIVCYENMKKSWASNKLLSVLFFIGMLAVIFVPQFIQFFADDFAFSYGAYGILMVLIFHIFKGQPLLMIVGYFYLSVLGVYLSAANSLFHNSASYFGVKLSFWESFQRLDLMKQMFIYKDSYKTLSRFFFQSRSIMGLAAILIFEKLYVPIKLNKYAGYLFYPAHITALLLVAKFFGTPNW